jgi:hypothetical protein
MKTLIKRSRPLVFVSSTLGTTLMSILVAWVVSSLAFAPVVATRNIGPSSHYLFQISPIPPGVDWAV